MDQVSFPADYQQIMPYLIVPKASEFITFMQTVFGAEERMRVNREDGLIMHAEISIGVSVIMLADSSTDYPPNTAGMFIYVADADSTYEKALANGAKSILPPRDADYGRTSGVTDPFGNVWWITHDVQKG